MRPETTTQFVARVLGIADYPPQEQKRGARYGVSAQCWLCGGETGGVGWPQDFAIAPTFTNHNQARAPQSDAVCQPCAALTRAESWQGVVSSRGMSVKTWTQAGWHSYSHFVCDDGRYECPTPSRVREILLMPPAGKWVLGVNPSGKKHTLFKAGIASGARFLTVQFDETRVACSHGDFVDCLSAFEGMTALGVAKDDAFTGRYNPASVMRARSAWKPAEDALRAWRSERGDLLELVAYLARSATAQGFDFDAAKEARAAKHDQRHVMPPTPSSQPEQMSFL